MKNNLIIYCFALSAFVSACKKENNQKSTAESDNVETLDTLTLNTTDVSYTQPLVPGTFRLIAGKAGSSAAVDGNGSSARFLSPSGIFVNTDASLLVADLNGYIRRLEHDTIVTTVPFPADGGGNPFDGASDVAVTADGTIAAVDGHELWLVNGGSSFYTENPNDNYEGIDRDPSGEKFWYTGRSNLFEIFFPGQVTSRPPNVGTRLDFKAISTSNNGVKYFATTNQMFKYTKAGISARIFPEFSFTNITSITSSRDGYRVYVADDGNIRAIANNSRFPKTITTILTGQKVVGIALSNSGKYIYFTTTNNTVNKLAL